MLSLRRVLACVAAMTACVALVASPAVALLPKDVAALQGYAGLQIQGQCQKLCSDFGYVWCHAANRCGELSDPNAGSSMTSRPPGFISLTYCDQPCREGWVQPPQAPDNCMALCTSNIDVAPTYTYAQAMRQLPVATCRARCSSQYQYCTKYTSPAEADMRTACRKKQLPRCLAKCARQVAAAKPPVALQPVRA